MICARLQITYSEFVEFFDDIVSRDKKIVVKKTRAEGASSPTAGIICCHSVGQKHLRQAAAHICQRISVPTTLTVLTLMRTSGVRIPTYTATRGKLSGRVQTVDMSKPSQVLLLSRSLQT
jgi:hypothetical protein